MEIVWSSLATEHFARVLNYVEEYFGSSIAQKTYQTITAKVNQLAAFPQIGIPDFNLSSSIKGLEVRHLIIAPNIVYYLIDHNEVVIVIIVHFKQSPDTVRGIISEFLKQYR
jgi:toxin ParE1/3/4